MIKVIGKIAITTVLTIIGGTIIAGIVAGTMSSEYINRNIKKYNEKTVK